jgi:hypothetical protein
MPKADVQIINHGSVVAFHPLTKRAERWIRANVEFDGWQRLGSALVVDHRHAAPLADGMAAELEIA